MLKLAEGILKVKPVLILLDFSGFNLGIPTNSAALDSLVKNVTCFGSNNPVVELVKN